MALERWILRFRVVISFLLVVASWQLVAWLEIVPRKYFPTIPEVAVGFWSMLISKLLSSSLLPVRMQAITSACAD